MRFTVTLLLATLIPAAATAHEVLHRVEAGGAMAVKVFESDGDVADNAVYEVYSPKDPARPFQTGHTDRNGYLSFVPDARGKWRVKVTQDDGHGIDIQIDPGSAAARGTDGGAPWYWRLAGGIVIITVVFAGLYLAAKHRRPSPRAA